MTGTVELEVNGKQQQILVEPGEFLLGALREKLDLTGTKYGCGEGQCGACTVLVDGKPRRSCTTTVASVAGRSVVTIEGIANGDALHPLQEAFLEADALQCGYCTPGMIVSAAGLLARNANPTEQQIVEHMQGNICRCGTYPRIVRAVRKAAERKRGGR